MQWIILFIALVFVVRVIYSVIQDRQGSYIIDEWGIKRDIDTKQTQQASHVLRTKPKPSRHKNDPQPPTDAEIISKFSPDNGIDLVPHTSEPDEPVTVYERPNTELWSGARKVTIEYKDSKGSFTTRDVKMTSVFSNQYGELCMKGRCLLRDSTRTFKGDRIRVITTARGKEYPDFFEYVTEELSI
ncbi:hypothetical protein P3521_03625 [Vibrio parahaemolyticus]|nr:hypothetical protein [Vibrio parahaemolyticus]HAV1412760.1 hypothetical protein [Vibrio parahaemolyticus]HAV2004843.1 hypothetical protein [Vibrio parahaemolyticus]